MISSTTGILNIRIRRKNANRKDIIFEAMCISLQLVIKQRK